MYYAPILKIDKYFDKSGMKSKIIEIYNQEMFHVLLGQNWDISWHKGVIKPTEAQYYQMVAHKTGVLLRLNARMIGTALKLKKFQINGLASFVEALGTAFQIQDDIIAITSEEYEKERGLAEDIREGKRSLMVTRIIQKDTPKA